MRLRSRQSAQFTPRRILALVIGAAALALPHAARADDAASPQTWKGVVDLHGQMKLEFVVVLSADDSNAWTGRIDIPVQGVVGMALTDVRCDGKTLHFELAPAGAPYKAVFDAAIDESGDAAKGTLNQGGVTAALEMSRISASDAANIGPRRPQTPNPPFPYDQRELTCTCPADGVTLAGTLTLPRGNGPFPAAILITGSGAQNRDEDLMGHKPFAVIADHLTRNGVAVLRTDDRGVGGSGGDLMDTDHETLAADALACVALLQRQPEIDRKNIGLIGHSEGGVVAPLAAARSKHVAFIVLLAGPGVPGGELIAMQLDAIMSKQGVKREVIDQNVATQRRVNALVTADNLDQGRLRELLRDSTAGSMPGADATVIDTVVDQKIRMCNTVWFRSFLRHDPRDALRQVTCPTLALGGELDLQVPPKENLSEIRGALEAAGNRHVTIRELPGLNHLFQEARFGLPQEYVAIEQTFSPAALNELSKWILAQSKGD
jgi:hypothetical protein